MPSFTLRDLCSRVNGELVGNGDLIITDAAKIDSAGQGEITFLANPRYKPFLQQTRASAVILDKQTDPGIEIAQIRVDDVYFRFLQIFLLFNPRKEILEPGIHPSAVIHPSAKVGKEVTIGANTYLGQRVKIGDHTKIFPGCVLLDEVTVGEHCILYPLVSIREECQVGNRVIIHNGTVIGSDGFGFAPFEGRYHKIPQIGRVIIEDEVEIGANCTIDRATMGETIIHKGAKLDNLIHIAHNVEVGESTVMAAQVGISGSTKIGHHVMLGGQVGTVGHITIGNYAQVGAQSGVPKNVPDNEVYFGFPARPIMRTKRIEAVVNQLPELLKRVIRLEKELEKYQQKNPDSEK